MKIVRITENSPPLVEMEFEPINPDFIQSPLLKQIQKALDFMGTDDEELFVIFEESEILIMEAVFSQFLNLMVGQHDLTNDSRKPAHMMFVLDFFLATTCYKLVFISLSESDNSELAISIR